MKGTLYVVATPIGNMDDITPRAVGALKAADIIAAEDTRVSKILLNRHGIKKPMVSCHKFNERARLDSIINKLAEGAAVALISDAGTPCISDPGYILVREAAAAGYNIIPVCGPCAAAAALSVSGFELKSFTFYGFLPKGKTDIRKALDTVLKDSSNVAVFYESPHRIVETIRLIGECFENASLCVLNDMTKKFERIYRGGTEEVLDELIANPDHEKGEYTIVLKKWVCDSLGKTDVPQCNGDSISAEALLTDIIIKRGLSLKDAVNALAAENKGILVKKDIYAAGLRLKEIFAKR